MIVGRPEIQISGGMGQTDQTEREIERAWLQHDPARDRVPSDIWRQLRSIKREIEPTSLKIRATLQDEKLLHQLVGQCTRRRGMARQRLLKASRRSFPGAAIKLVHGDILEISWLAPSPPVIADPKDHGEAQACTLVCYVVAWPSPFGGIRLCSAWTMECPDHAAGRFLQRAGNHADLRTALFQAANNFYAADMAAVKPHVGRGTDVYLPAGDGAFVATVIGARSGAYSFVYARCGTWIEAIKLRPNQTLLPKAEAADRSVAARPVKVMS
jgi:hypothetical protein